MDKIRRTDRQADFKQIISSVTNSLAFTLAEVLITLGIIGVVAALTIPTLLNSFEESQNKVAWKNAYSLLSNAYSQILNENDGTFKNVCSDSDCIKTLFTKYLSYIKDCSSTTTNGTNQCIYNTSTSLKRYGDGQPCGFAWNTAGLVLNNGIIVLLQINSADCSFNNSNSNVQSCGYLIVDTNGNARPNTLGKDVFQIWVTKTSLVPIGTKDENNAAATYYNSASCDKTNPSAYGAGCSSKFLLE